MSNKYNIYTPGTFGPKLVKKCQNLLHAKRWIAKHYDGRHYEIHNTGRVLYSL
jgi:hypothetical protein